ncbi:MAG: FAD-binding oxidoreductase [Planctomycetes bacterium]|nr:FAD-binding oxidoreductase [Planctomycetota bacterium]
MRVDTLIVGGGVMGASIALARARATDPITAPVALLERRGFGAGSSGRSGAICRQFYSDSELIGMARDSLREYASFETRHGRAIGFTRSGVLTIGGPARPLSLRLVERNAALMRSCGAEVELLDARAMRALVPGIEVSDGALGAWEPGAGFVDPQRTVEAFIAAARGAGATARTGVEVVELLLERARVRGVRTSDGEIECERLVIAAGPWTRRLMRGVGVELPLEVVRPEQHFLAMLPERMRTRPTLSGAMDAEFDPRFAASSEPEPAHPVLLDIEHGYYTRCEPSRERTRVGAMDYDRDRVLEDPDSLDEAVSPEFSAWSRAALARRLPRYAAQPDVGTLAAWYTLTPDAQALIGRCPGLDNVFVAAGFSGHGFKLAPSIGEGVAQLLAGQPVGAFDPRFFDPARFALKPASARGSFGL